MRNTTSNEASMIDSWISNLDTISRGCTTRRYAVNAFLPHPATSLSLLGTIHLHPVFHGLELFLIIWNSGALGRGAKNHLRLHAPRRRHVELGLQADVDERIVMLQVHPQAFRFQRGPDYQPPSVIPNPTSMLEDVVLSGFTYWCTDASRSSGPTSWGTCPRRS